MKKVISVLICSVLVLSGCVKVYTQESQNTGRLVISSSAELKVAPDEMSISLGIEKYDSSVKRARALAAGVVEKLVKSLAEIGITEDNIEYGTITISPRYPEKEYGKRIIGYTTTMSVTLKLQDFDLISEAVDRAVSSGVNTIGSFQFYSTKMPEHKKKVRSLAIEAALAKAKQYEKEMGLSLGKLISVRERSNNNPDMMSNVVQRSEFAYAGIEEEKGISAGDISLSLYIDCEYEIVK